MSATIIRPVKYDSASAAQLHVVASWRAQPGALMLLGRSAGPVAKSGSARLKALASAAGIFRAECWPLKGEAGTVFLVAIRLPDGVDAADDAELILRGARATDRDFRLASIATSGAASFGEQVAALVGVHAARLARFMLDMMAPDGRNDMRQPGAMLEAFLTHAARPDGCVELVMHVPQKCVLLQGWGIRPSDDAELLLPSSSSLRHDVRVGEFSRGDVAAPASGNVLVLPPELASELAFLQKVFLLSGDDLLCRQVVEPTILDVDASIGQIRHLLPRLNCPVPLLSLLRATVQPLYEGRDTLNAAGRPVRAALDVAVATSGGGAYLSGWLFDPAGHMAELHLCADDFAVRLDENWVRVPREDVSVAFQADPAFPSPPSDEAGFAIAIPTAPAPGRSAYLRLTFADGELAFMPVRFASTDAQSVLKTLLASVDLHKSSGVAIVARHLAPFIAQLPAPKQSPAQIVLEGPFQRPLAIVVPLCTPSLPRSFISTFLHDPATEDEQIVFVCGPEWGHAQREGLVELIRFYDLPASIIGVAATPHSASAVRDAAGLSQAGSFLLVSPGVIGRTPGWRGSLARAACDDRVACPTVLFEDQSVRFAGSTKVTFLDRAPFASISTPFTGGFGSLAIEDAATDVDGGTFACCLIPRNEIGLLTEATRFGTEAGQEAAFFMLLRDAGLNRRWVPSVTVSAPEEDAPLTAPALPLIDGWMLRHIWGEASPCVS